ncbi:MAG: M10 family metallopeptidase C-terminal domain-containing protein, partial [Caulobacter sp.]|nr:M10 family metallopeptidase C-terminal domain-containing protein [Caulobacter sp.]
MPFDQEDVLSEPGTRLFQPTPPGLIEHDEGAVRCACPACAGLVDSDATSPGVNPPAFLDAADRGETGPNGKTSKTVAEAAYHLNRTYASWNDFWVQPGVSDVDNKWDDPYWGGAPSIVTFAFRSTAPATMPSGTSGFSRFTEQQIAVTLLALQAWSDVANIVFVRVGDGEGDAAYSNAATILFSNYAEADDNAAAFAYYPSLSAAGGDVWVKSTLPYNANPVAGGYGSLVLIHEIGHAIGFAHPGSYNAAPGVNITYADNAEYYEDSHQYTVMSYFTENNTGANFGPLYPATIMLDDIAAAQRTYGVNTTTRTGDTVYGFNSTADRPWFSATTANSKLIFAVWDAGGVDTLDFSGYSQAQTITLIQGHFSSVGGLIGNVAIAMGAVIENAIGGSGADTIIGNGVANRLTGNAGNDTLTGGGGADIFVATIGGGADTITDFSAASDLIDVSAFGGYVSAVQNGLNTLVTVAVGMTFTLLNFTATTLTAANFITGASPPPAGYNLVNGTGSGETLNGTGGSDQIYGLAGDDILNGGDSADWLEGGPGNDLLNGGAGADMMIGGAGDDTYVVDNIGDQVVEEAGGGSDTVQTALASYSLGAHVENLTGTSGSGQTLTGNGLDNVLTGAGGADVLEGGAGNDRLNGGAGADAMTGGAGDDTYVVDNVGDTTVEVAGGGNDTVETSLAAYTLAAEIENLVGTSGAGQALTGNALANSITGGAGADTINGGAGNDILAGGGGADIFLATAGGGEDTISDFVVGTDRIDVSAFGGYQSIVQAGGDTLVTVASGVTFRLTGVTAGTVTDASFIGLGAAYNQITGTDATEVIYGTAQADHILGLGGADTIRAGAGNDWLEGGADGDKLFGEDGND